MPAIFVYLPQIAPARLNTGTMSNVIPFPVKLKPDVAADLAYVLYGHCTGHKTKDAMDALMLVMKFIIAERTPAAQRRIAEHVGQWLQPDK